MNRRTTIKSILALGALITSGFSIFKWLKVNRTPDLDYLLSKKELIAEFAEMIIPATDTPGAKDAKVEDFIIDMILNCTAIKNQNIFLDGLQEVEDYSYTQFKESFVRSSLAEKEQIVAYFEDKSSRINLIVHKIEKKLFGEPFYTQIKYLTVMGYCTSELGATKGLAYDYIPEKYDACILLQPHQKSWATK